MLLFIVVILFVIIGVALTWFFIAHDHGEKEPISALWIAVGLGLLGAVAAGFFENLVIPIQDIQGPGPPLLVTLAATLGVGAIEEFLKFVPLAIFIYRKRYFNEHTDGIIYFALAGLGFGIPENVLYTFQFGAKTGLIRLVLTPVFHAATTSMVGYFLIKSKLDRKSLFIPIVALIGAMLIHGVYDFGLTSGILLYTVISFIITASMTATLFILFWKSNVADRAAGLSVVGNNSFCRSCGYPNPKHELYCTHCGNYA